MSGPGQSGRGGGTWQSLVSWYVALCGRRGGTVLLVAVLVAVVTSLGALRIRVDGRLDALLPDGTPTRLALAAFRERAATRPPLTLLIQSSDPALNRRLSDELLAAVSAWPETRYAINRRDAAYFLEHRLLYVPALELEKLAEDAEAYLRWEECKARPACVNIDSRPPTPELETLRASYENLPEVRAIGGMLGLETFPAPGAPAAEDEVLSSARPGDLCSGDGTVCAVHVELHGDPGDIDFATSVLLRSRATFASIRPAGGPTDLKMAVNGLYRDAPMTREMVSEDLRRTAGLGGLLVLFVLLAHFRGPRSMALLLLPLFTGAGITAGVIGLLHPTLNVISAFTLVVLAGLGVDFSVHLLTHYGDRRGRGDDPQEAMRRSLLDLVPALAIAAVTTACGFGALATASFRGFSEMGVLASFGIVVTAAATLLVLPAATLWLAARFPERGSLIRDWALARLFAGVPRRGALYVVVGGGVVAALLGLSLGRHVEMENNFRKLRPKVVSHGIPHGRAMHGTTRTVVYVLGADAAALEDAAATLRSEGSRGLTRGEGGWIFTPATFLPPDQERRLRALKRLHASVRKAERYGDGEFVERVGRWGSLLAVSEPMVAGELPEWVVKALVDKGGRFGTLGVLYSDLSGADARDMEFLAGRITEWRIRFPRVTFAAPVALLGEIVPTLREEAPRMILFALLGLILGTAVVSRSAQVTLVGLAALGLAAALTVGGMAILGWKVHLYNMLVFPLAFGIGIDGAIYVTWARRSGASGEGWESLAVPARGVLISTLTTLVAFGCTMVSTNPGIAAMGRLCVLALGATLLANLLWLPAVLWVLPRSSGGGPVAA